MKNHCKDNHFYVIKHSFRAQIPKFNIFYYLKGGHGGWVDFYHESYESNESVVEWRWGSHLRRG